MERKIFLKSFILLFALCKFLFSGDFEVDDYTLFLVHFNGSCIADYAKGQKEPVSDTKTLKYEEGMMGKSLVAKGADFKGVTYKSLGNINPEDGKIEILFNPEFSLNKSDSLTIYRLFFTSIKNKNFGIGINNRGGDYFLWFLMIDPERNLMNYGIYKKVEIEKNKWYKIIATWDEKEMALYLNDSLIGKAESKIPLPIGETFTIGSYGERDIADSLIDEFKISSKKKMEIKKEAVSQTVENPSFEKGEKEILGWEVKMEEGARGKFFLTDNFSSDGEKSLCIEKETGRGYIVLSTKNYIGVEGGKTYWLTYDVHLEKSYFGAFFYTIVLIYRKDGSSYPVYSAFDRRILPLSLPKEWRKFSILFTPLQDAEKIEIRIVISGNPSKIYFDNFKLRLYSKEEDSPLPEWENWVYNPPEKPYKWEEVISVLEKRENAQAKIEKKNGRPVLLINERETVPIFYSGCYWKPNMDFNYDFSKAGIKIHQVHIPLTLTVSIWKGHKNYDFTIAEERIKSALMGAPDAYLILDFSLISPYPEWGNLYPDDVIQDQFGEKGIGKGVHLYRFGTSLKDPDEFWVYSYYSDTLKKEANEVLLAFIDYLKKQPYYKAIIGFGFCGGDDGQWSEWGHRATDKTHLTDYSPAGRKSFKNYILEKYKTLKNLKDAFDDPNINFDAIDVPSVEKRMQNEFFYHPKKDRLCIEYNKFRSEKTVELLLSLAKTAKENMGKPIICLSYWADLNWVYAGSTHLALRKILESPYLDITVTPMDYGYLRIPGAWGGKIGGTTGSLSLHNKIFLVELDTRTWRTRYTGYESYCSVGYLKNIEEFSSVNFRELGRMITYNMGVWYYDMSGGWFSDPKIMESISTGYKVYEEILKKKTNFKPEFLIVLDEESVHYLSTGGPLYAWAFQLISHHGNVPSYFVSGVPYEVCVLEDLISNWENFKDYKVYVFPFSYYMDKKIRNFINENLKKNNKTLVWVFAPGYINENGISIENVKEMIEMEIKKDEKISNLTVESVISDHPLSKGLPPLLLTCDGRYATGPKFWIEDEKAIIIGKYVNGGEPAIGVKKFSNWTSIYLASPGTLTPELINNIAKYSGCYVASEPGDVVNVNDLFLSIHGIKGGEKEILLPRRCNKIIDAFTKKIVATNTNKIKLNIPLRKTLWFILE